MTTPSEEEARAEAEARWPQEWFYTEGSTDPNFTPRRIPVEDGRRAGFVEGAMWAASRVSTPPADVEELERLRGWKAEAIDVLNRWEQVWEAAGRPGRLGRSKADNVREWIEARALSTPPSEHARESLAAEILEADRRLPTGSLELEEWARFLAEHLISKGFRPSMLLLDVDEVAKALCRIEGRSTGRSLEEVVAPGVELWMRHRYEAERLIEELSPLLAVPAVPVLPTEPAEEER